MDLTWKLRKRLEQQLDCNQLLNNIKKGNAYITGSFPLQVFLDKTWDDSDLDIFCKDYTVRDYLKGIYNYKKIESYLPSNMEVYEFITPCNFRIQTMINKQWSNLQEIWSDFDLDCCKIAFDGQDWFFGFDKDKLKETMHTNILITGNNTALRMAKYRERGFRIDERIFKYSNIHRLNNSDKSESSDDSEYDTEYDTEYDSEYDIEYDTSDDLDYDIEYDSEYDTESYSAINSDKSDDSICDSDCDCNCDNSTFNDI